MKQYKLEVDWDGRPSEFTCYQPKNRLPVSQSIRPLRTCFDIPSDYIVSINNVAHTHMFGVYIWSVYISIQLRSAWYAFLFLEPWQNFFFGLLFLPFFCLNQPQHYCMSRTIEYDELIPTFGNHRPLWPIYGEYRYLPVQRWLHSLEVKIGFIEKERR